MQLTNGSTSANVAGCRIRSEQLHKQASFFNEFRWKLPGDATENLKSIGVKSLAGVPSSGRLSEANKTCLFKIWLFFSTLDYRLYSGIAMITRVGT